MKIGITCNFSRDIFKSGKRDGIGVYTESLITEYTKMGIQLNPYVYNCAINNTPAIKLPLSFERYMFMHMCGFPLKAKIDADIFHCTDYRSINMSCPVVSTLYDAIPFVHPSMANGRLRSLKNYILRRAADCADHIIAISKFSVRELVEYYKVSESKLSVVYCGVDEDWLNHSATNDEVDQFLYRHGLERGYFLTVGTLQPRKNLNRLMDAHSRLPIEVRRSHPLVVVGKRGWNCEDLVAQLKQKVSEGEARWLDNIESREDLKRVYAGAEAFLFPSLYEGFGLPVLEAFAMGLPVLTSNTTSLPEVSNGIALEVNPLNVNELVDGMRYLLRLPDRVAKIAAGKERARELSWNRCADETFKVYKKVLSGK